MKISINYKIKTGPWGGGNRFVKELSDAFVVRGHHVVTSLDDDDIDLILLIDPRWRNRSVSYSFGAVARYLRFDNPNAIVVHRVNECDERKGTRFINGQLARANLVADHTIFVGGWLKKLNVWKNKSAFNSSVILNGANQHIFNSIGHQLWNGTGVLKIVTHHWGSHWNKGFDIYTKLDSMLSQKYWRNKLEFTYIGNLPQEYKFQYAAHIPPLDGNALADELRRHHIYLTASINEPGGNHQNEGALCGLPLLYRNSGCMPEYCDGYGESFSFDTFENSLLKIISNYFTVNNAIASYPHTAKIMCAEYIKLFEELVQNRGDILKRRNSKCVSKFLIPQLPALF